MTAHYLPHDDIFAAHTVSCSYKWVDVCQHLVFPKTSLQRYSVRCFKFWDSPETLSPVCYQSQASYSPSHQHSPFFNFRPKEAAALCTSSWRNWICRRNGRLENFIFCAYECQRGPSRQAAPLSKLISPLAHPPIMFCARLSCTACVFLAFALPQSLSLSAGHVTPARDRLDPPSLILLSVFVQILVLR